MRTIKSRYVMLLVPLVALPSVLLLCASSTWLVVFALGIAVLTNSLIADYSEDNPLYEDVAEDQNFLSEEKNEETVATPYCLWA